MNIRRGKQDSCCHEIGKRCFFFDCSHADFIRFSLPPGNPKRASKKPTNCSSILRTSLQNLLSKIELRKCHYVFCIKSNDKKLAKTFEISIVQHQVRFMR